MEREYEAYLSLGSNLGNRQENLRTALHLLHRTPGVILRRVSSFYETSPWGKTDQPNFINAAAKIKTRLAPETLLAECLAIENKLGRVRLERWGERSIDIDLIHIPGVTRKTEELTLPHPYYKERSFVLKPLAEIAPGLVIEGAKAEELWLASPDRKKVRPASGSPKDFKLILLACVDKNWGLGYRGQLLFHLPEDLRRFKERTWGQNIILGRKTLATFPEGKPLPDRNNLVLSSTLKAAPGMTIAASPEDLWLKLAATTGKNYLIGGGEIYRCFLPYVEEAFVTMIMREAEAADVYLPNLDENDDFVQLKNESKVADEDFFYEFKHYVRRKF